MPSPFIILNFIFQTWYNQMFNDQWRYYWWLMSTELNLQRRSIMESEFETNNNLAEFSLWKPHPKKKQFVLGEMEEREQTKFCRCSRFKFYLCILCWNVKIYCSPMKMPKNRRNKLWTSHSTFEFGKKSNENTDEMETTKAWKNFAF